MLECPVSTAVLVPSPYLVRGHGIRRLEVCARKEEYEVLGKDKQVEWRRVLGNDVMVPLLVSWPF